MESPLRLGVIGYGLAGSAFHAPIIAAVPDLEVAAIMVRDSHRQLLAGERYPNAKIVSDLDVFLDLNLDGAVVATPNATHFDMATKLLDSDISVVVDKPMTTSLRQAEQLVEQADRRGLILASYQNRRFDGDFLSLQRLVKDNELGQVFRFESRFERFRSQVKPGWKEVPGLGTGVLWDLGPHLIDQAIALFGSPILEYSEVVKVRSGAEVDDSAFIVLAHPGGVKSHLSVSAAAGAPGPRFRVLGSAGAYLKYGIDPQEDALRSGRDPRDINWGRESAHHWGELRAGDSSRPVATVPGDYREFYRQFATALRRNGPVPVDPADTLRVIQIIEEAHATGSH